MSRNTFLPAIRRVAVIGAGPIGISTTKYLQGECRFSQVDVFEQQSSFGGAWIWSQPREGDASPVPQTSPFGPLDQIRLDTRGIGSEVKPPTVMTPMYDNLETNIPHVLMTFSDKQFPDNVQLFPPREAVLRYIEEYGSDIKHCVKFSTQVTRLEMRVGSEGQDLWSLSFKNVLSGEVATAEYDAVALANGHFALPSLPAITGMELWHEAYPGSIKHAKWYRNAEQFRGKKVVIVGNASSGIDIGSQVATTCKKPVIMSARSEPLFKLPDYAENVERPDIVEYIDPREKNRAVQFADGSVEEDVDVVLYCTGYFMNFPFLEDNIQNEITNTGYMVHGTYEHLFWRQHPTLAFMALPNKVLPMPLGEAQGAVVARVWSGRLQLPSKTHMDVWELERWRTQAEFLQSRGKSINTVVLEKAFHGMGYPQDLDYHNSLVKWAASASPGKGKELPHVWNEREYWYRKEMAAIKKAYANLRDEKHAIKSLEQLGFDYEKHRAEQELEERSAAEEALHQSAPRTNGAR